MVGSVVVLSVVVDVDSVVVVVVVELDVVGSVVVDDVVVLDVVEVVESPLLSSPPETTASATPRPITRGDQDHDERLHATAHPRRRRLARRFPVATLRVPPGRGNVHASSRVVVQGAGP